MSSSPEPAPSWSQPASDVPASPPHKPPLEKAALGTGRPVEKIRYLDAIRSIFAHPEWFKNLLMGSLCLFIPVLNQLIIFGYSYEITEMLHRRQTTTYPLFDFKRFTAYITRGVWPFLISFIVQTILQPVIQFSVQGSVMGTMMALENDETVGTIVAAIVIPLVIIFLLVLTVGLTLVLTPLLMRAGLSQDFVQAFRFGWIKDFIRRMWLETILVNLFVILTSCIFVPLGCILFCYPGFVIAMGLSIAGANLNWQLYELYLARGGEPIPLKPLPADVPPVVQAAQPTA